MLVWVRWARRRDEERFLDAAASRHLAYSRILHIHHMQLVLDVTVAFARAQPQREFRQ